MPATLIARCLNCSHSAALPPEAIFDFDARCPACSEVLVLEEGEAPALDVHERPTLRDELPDLLDPGSPEDEPDDEDEPEDEARGPRANAFQGLGLGDRAGIDILALAASALDPDIDLNERQFGGVREVPEVRLGQSGESGRLAPTDSSRMRHQLEAAAATASELDPPRGLTVRASQRLSFDGLTPESELVDEAPARSEFGASPAPAPLPAPLSEFDADPDEEAALAAALGETRPPLGDDDDELGGVTTRLASSGSIRLIDGEIASAPPLPSWDGGDTQQVGALARTDPGLLEAVPLELGAADLPLATAAARREPARAQPAAPRVDPTPEPLEDLEELAALVELPDRDTSGRMSRVYDAAELVVGPDGAVDLPPAPAPREPLSYEAVPLDQVPRDAVQEPISRMFQDAEWLALLDDTLTETEEDDDAGRRVIRISQTTAADMEDPERLRSAQSTLERDGAAALEALLLGGTGEGRSVQRFPKDAVQPDTALFNRQGPEPTQSFKRPVDEAEPTKSFARPEPDSTKNFGREAEPDTRQWGSGVVKPPPASGEKPLGRPSNRRPSDRLAALSASQIRPRLVVERFHRDQLDPGLVCVSDLEAPEADLFRQLYEQVFHGTERVGGDQTREGERTPRVVLVTSARPGEGKTTVASNLAVVGARVPGEGAVLVNADPRGRGVLRAFGQRASTDGLLEALSTDRDPSRYVVRFHLNELDVIPLGLRGSNAAELIASASMRQFLERLRRLYPRQSILIDGSSVLGAADPLALARMVDRVLLVVRARRTAKVDVEQAIRLIGRERLAGIVLNDAVEVA